MWNDTDMPMAFLITFRCYGTWLHGDIRGSVDRNRNVFGAPKFPHEPVRKDYVRSLLKRKSVLLDAQMRQSVEKAIRETCQKRNWVLLAVNVRTNHVHTVVATGTLKPTAVLTAFKANATRMMRADGCWKSEETPWVEKGSRRYLWNEKSVELAIEYVLYGQGSELPDFD